MTKPVVEETEFDQRLRRTSRWGVDLMYQDVQGKWHETSEETLSSVHRCMNVDARDESQEEAAAGAERWPVIFLREGQAWPALGRGILTLESGEKRKVAGTPVDIPFGYHTWEAEQADALATPLISTPARCWLPADLETWGFSVQLYGARSRTSWGIGDLKDLQTLARWSKDLGAGMLLLNPLSAATPVKPQQSSPYYPTSRVFLNPLCLHVPSLPGARDGSLAEIEKLAVAGCALNDHRLIDRDRIFDLKFEAFNLLWKRFRGDEAFDRFCGDRGHLLDGFARFCALAEHFGSGWHGWNPEFSHPRSPAVDRFAIERAERVQFYKWLQWMLDRQLADGSRELALMQDLPIGVDPDGADAWAWQDVLAQNVGVGAPPDEFNTQGQDWGLPPFVPHKLREAGYGPFIQTIRAAFRHCGGLRIDHVMGLFRLFWVPAGLGAPAGAYVRYNEDELLSILALESHRARAYVVGEDLGTVEEGAREKLASANVLSYRLLWFEKKSPHEYPREALAAITTHDLPTVMGLWNGSDLARQAELGLNPNLESTAEIRDRLATIAEIENSAPAHQVVIRAYQTLAAAPCRILTATLDDTLEVEERPNIPATRSDQNPNWSVALPEPIEVVTESSLARQVAQALHTRLRS